MKRVLLCSESWPPVGSGGGVQRPLKFAKYLGKYGYESEVLSPEMDRKRFVADESLLEEAPGIPCHRVPRSRSVSDLLPGDLRKIWKRIVPAPSLVPDDLVRSHPAFLAAAAALHAERPFQILFTTSPPHSFALLGKKLQERLGLPWVADFRDEWGKNALLPGAGSEEHRRVERECLEAADRILTTTHVMRRNVLAAASVAADRVVVIPNGYDETDLPPPADHQYGDCMVVTYSGVLNSYRRLDTLFEAVRGLREEDPAFPIRFRFLTPPDRARRHLRAQADLLRAGVIEIVGFLPHRRSLVEAKKADVLLHVLSNSGPEDEPVAGKLFEYICLERPILFLTSVRGENAAIIEETGTGTTVDLDDVEAIRIALRELHLRWKARDLHVVPRNLEPYRRRHLTGRLAREFDALL
jgi:glycosyltransferase involved in cell wall biosynthesis